MTQLSRRRLLGLATIPLFAAAIAACGDDGEDQSSGPDPSDSTPGGSDAPTYDTDRTVAALRIDMGVGGFTTPEYSFGNIPALLVTGDGTVYVPGAIAEIFPGPFLLPIMQGTATPEQITKVLTMADAAGLLTDAPDYSMPGGQIVADAGATVVVINANADTFTHQAEALGILPTETPARANLQKFVDAVIAELTPLATAPATIERYAIWARQEEVGQFDPTVEPKVVPWPADLGIELASATCVEVEAAKVADLFAQADQITYFSENDVTYRIAVRPLLPGSTPC